MESNSDRTWHEKCWYHNGRMLSLPWSSGNEMGIKMRLSCIYMLLKKVLTKMKLSETSLSLSCYNKPWLAFLLASRCPTTRPIHAAVGLAFVACLAICPWIWVDGLFRLIPWIRVDGFDLAVPIDPWCTEKVRIESLIFWFGSCGIGSNLRFFLARLSFKLDLKNSLFRLIHNFGSEMVGLDLVRQVGSVTSRLNFCLCAETVSFKGHLGMTNWKYIWTVAACKEDCRLGSPNKALSWL